MWQWQLWTAHADKEIKDCYSLPIKPIWWKKRGGWVLWMDVLAKKGENHRSQLIQKWKWKEWAADLGIFPWDQTRTCRGAANCPSFLSWQKPEVTVCRRPLTNVMGLHWVFIWIRNVLWKGIFQLPPSSVLWFISWGQLPRMKTGNTWPAVNEGSAPGATQDNQILLDRLSWPEAWPLQHLWSGCWILRAHSSSEQIFCGTGLPVTEMLSGCCLHSHLLTWASVMGRKTIQVYRQGKLFHRKIGGTVCSVCVWS